MDKTFDVVFHVAAPVVSDWQNFMTEVMRSTLPSDIVDLHGHEVARIYSSRVRGRVTPRELNRQVNAMAALWLQCRGLDVTFPVVAYYSIHRDDLDADLLGAIETASVDLSEERGWRESLAAVHFGVPAADAIQILLAPEIVDSIRDLDRESFAKQVSYRGFDRVVERLLAEEQIRLSALANLADLLTDVPT